MSLFDLLTDPDPSRLEQPFCRQRTVPAQPAGVPPGKVYLGSDIGEIDYTGEKPQPGDQVLITGPTARRTVHTGQRVPPLTNPVFSGGCLCKCPGLNGVAFYMGSVGRASAILAIDTQTGGLSAVFGMSDLLFGRGIAIDPLTPYNLYVLDDRRILREKTVVGTPVPARGYFTLVTFELSAGAYGASAYHNLTDPFPLPSSIVDYPGITVETQDTDPPNFNTQCLSVIDHIPYLTLYNTPARYLTLNGGTFTTHTLQLDGSPYSKGLRGQIVTVPNRPAAHNRRYAIATDGVDYEIVQFTEADEITHVYTLSNDPIPRQLAAVCNQLLALHGNTSPLFPTFEAVP